MTTTTLHVGSSVLRLGVPGKVGTIIRLIDEERVCVRWEWRARCCSDHVTDELVERLEVLD